MAVRRGSETTYTRSASEAGGNHTISPSGPPLTSKFGNREGDMYTITYSSLRLGDEANVEFQLLPRGKHADICFTSGYCFPSRTTIVL